MASPPARRSAMIALVAIAEPIELGVNGLPFGAMTLAPALRQRSASRISAVMTTAVELARSAIQSSAASKPDPTTIRVTSGWTGDRKSVVEGKNVSVRVDLGVRRIIKKKKKSNKTIN